MPIHPTAIVDRSSQVDETAEIGAYAIVEPGAVIGPGVRLYPHAYVSQGTTLARGVQIHPFAVVGHPPQDLAFKGEPSFTQVGEDTIVREGATIHRGTMPGSTTIVGKRCFLMSNAHVAHNCIVGDDVKMAQAAMLGGHARIGPNVFIGGAGAVHQFVRIGELVMIGGLFRATSDVAPFLMVESGRLAGVNIIGLRRAGVPAEERQEIRDLFRLLWRSGRMFREVLGEAVERARTPRGRQLVAFLQEPSKRGVMSALHRRRGTSPAEAHELTSEA